MKDIETEIQNEAILPAVKYIACNPVTKAHFRTTNRGVVEKRSANGVTGDVVLLTPVGTNDTGSTRYKIGICDIVTAWSMQLSDNGLVVFTSKNIDAIVEKYNAPIKAIFLNLANTAKEAIEEETAKIKLEFLQALIENDVCIPKNNFNYGETKERAPSSDVSASPDSATSTTSVVPGRPATV
jgi:hypothetical protein